MRWIGKSLEDRAMLAREFVLHRDGRTVPGLLWTPSPARRRVPLVLLGHGGSQHKGAPGMVELAGRFVRRHGFAVAAIDGPIHGARRSDGQSGLAVQGEFSRMWQQDPGIDAMVADWRSTLDALALLEEIDAARIAWYGVSMGTAYGLPLIAADSRIGAALLGMWGSDFAHSERLVLDAPAVRCPLLFQLKWDDQFFSREGQLDLYDRLGAADKACKIYPGAHTPVEGRQMDDVEAFLSGCLSG